MACPPRMRTAATPDASINQEWAVSSYLGLMHIVKPVSNLYAALEREVCVRLYLERVRKRGSSLVIFFKFSFLNFRLPWVSIIVHSLSLIAAHRLLLLWNTSLRVSRLSSWQCAGLFSCGMWDVSSLIRAWTYVPCIGRRIFNHWTTREVSPVIFQLLTIY